MLHLQIFAHALRRNWWIVLLSAVSAVVAVLAIDLARSPTYRTSSRLLVVPNQTVYEGRDLIYGLDSLNTRSIVFTYVEVANSQRIYDQAISTLGLDAAERSQYQLSAVALPDSNVIEVAAQGPDPEMAANLANEVSRQTSDFIRETYDVYRLNNLDAAAVPLLPISPTPLRDATLALVLGLVIGVALAIARDQVQQPLLQFMQEWSAIDGTSSAYTRAHLQDRLEQHLEDEEESVGFGIIGLTGLRDLNLPRPILKQLLRRVTALLRSELRGKDTIGRWDEHSFAVVMTGTNQQEVTQTLSRIQRNLLQPIKLYDEGQEILLQPRTGAIVSPGQASPSTFIERAETALERAHLNGMEPVIDVSETSENELEPEAISHS